MSPLQFLSRRMVAKIFLATGVVVGATLVIQAVVDARQEARMLKQQTRESAEQIADLVVGAVDHTMLLGEGIAVEELINDLKDRVPDAEVSIYDHRGIEVFGPKPPVPPRDQMVPEVAAIIDSPKRLVASDGAVYRPVAAEDKCRECHDDDSKLRGVLSISFNAARCGSERNKTLTELAKAGFIHVMTSDNAKLLDDYFTEIAESPSIHGIAVYDRDGDVAFGTELPGVEASDVQPLFAKGAKPKILTNDTGSIQLAPLPMENRCVECHDWDGGAVRGVLALALSPEPASGCDSQAIEHIVDMSLHVIMMSRLGRRIADFLDDLAATAAVDSVALYDNKGRLYWTTQYPQPLAHVAGVLENKETASEFRGEGKSESVLVSQPLDNRAPCQRCHGGNNEGLRGVVTVELSTARAAYARETILRRRGLFAIGTLLVLLLFLLLMMQYLVLRPVREIGDVAEAVGGGDFSVRVGRADSDGDEVERLGHRVNNMVSGLRTKIQLEKLVSRGAAKAASRVSGIQRQGERRAATVLFSDIRGFTAYSELRPPEEVVVMLNRVLEAQAKIISKFDGDIDKFVGDEVMAVFHGEDAEVRAVQCGVQLVEVVDKELANDDQLRIGVGISSGSVVHGAIGADERMDFTIIGDVVNTGARLCSRAGPGEVLVTAYVQEQAAGADGIAFDDREPLKLRGKKDPLTVYKARSAS